MADTKISALTALAAPADEDLLAIVDDPSGTPATKKSTRRTVRAVPSAFANVTSGDITVTATSAASPTTVHDGLSVAAQAGDVLAVDVGYSAGTQDSDAIRMSAYTLNDADAQVNAITPGTLGVIAWASLANEATGSNHGGRQKYTLQAGDIKSDGTVKVRLVAWLAASGSKVIQAGTAAALHFGVENLGPA